MNQKSKTIDQVIEGFSIHLRKMGRCDRSVQFYRQCWEGLKVYMKENGFTFFSKAACIEYLISKFGEYQYHKLKESQKTHVNRIRALYGFYKTGTIINPQRKKHRKIPGGLIGDVMNKYIRERQVRFRLNHLTIINYHLALFSLHTFFQSKTIQRFEDITAADILEFVKTIDPNKAATRSIWLGVVKGFLKHLFEQGLLIKDCSVVISSVNRVRQQNLPSVFSKEEIKTLLSSVDRANPKGKRNYAILLLATKLGLRTSDIEALQFEHLKWEKNQIEFYQSKTKKHIALPLLPEVGNAIIDYIKYGRPASEERHVFLQQLPPYKRIRRSDIGEMVRLQLIRAGINIRGRKHGPHALRHSLAEKLLTNKTILPVISQALGHASSESTMYYLRIDAPSLMQCALPVQPLSASFYTQKGGPAL
jgi:site-specific recombinase XerD